VTVGAVLDWQGFTAKHFPERRRHDFEAVIAYSAYRRSSPIDGAGGARNGGAESRALEAWEDEGGPAAHTGASPIPTALEIPR
jgi:hypothetical protein